MSPPDEGSVATAVRLSRSDWPEDDATSRPKRSLNSPAGRIATQPDLDTLTRAVRRGDEEAFSRLYDLYSFRLYKFLLVLARGDESQAGEACQAVFIKLTKRCEVFSEERKLWAWLCVLAKNTFLDQCRVRQRLNRFVSLEALPVEPDGQVNPEHRLAEILQEALAALPPEEREWLQAAYVDNQPLQELANEAGQTYKAFESRLGRLRQKLKEQLLKNLRHENRF